MEFQGSVRRVIDEPIGFLFYSLIVRAEIEQPDRSRTCPSRRSYQGNR